MFGEVYNYNISSAREFDYGDKKVDFFDNGFQSLINFEFKYNCKQGYEEVFSKYDSILHSGMQGLTVVNYLTSHDDGDPFDKTREKPFEAGTKLILAPGSCQVYYGDESIRNLVVEGTNGDATLRSFMNWDEIKNNSSRGGYQVQDILAHYQKLGKFRAKHPAVGAGRHQMLSDTPYLFSRTLEKNGYQDQVVVGLELNTGQKTIDVSGTFPNGMELVDYYSGISTIVEDGKVDLDSPFNLVLLGI